MMASALFIGIGSGLAAALLFASMVSGSALSVILFYLAPLPIFIASLGWPHQAGLAGAFVGAAALSLGFNATLGGVFLAGIGLPAWYLSYLSLLASRDADGNAQWYPIGRVVLWAAVLSAFLTAISFPLLTGGLEDYQAAFKASLEAVLRAQLGTPEGAAIQLPNGADPDRFLDLMVLLLPPMAALTTMLSALMNLWLGARIVRRSGRLPRPWPDLAAEMALPRGSVLVLAALFAGSMLPGLPGLFSELSAITLTTAFVLLGFAVLHVVTRGVRARPMILTACYLLVLLQAWLILIAMIGIVEQIVGLRARVAARRTGPTNRIPPPTN